MSVPGHAASAPLLACFVSPTDTPWQIKVELRNQSQQPVLILRWHSPLDAWFSEFMSITQQQQKLMYQGAKAKRGKPQPEDLLLLQPLQQHTELLDLTMAYQLQPAPALLEFLPFALMAQPPGQPFTWQPDQQQMLQCPPLKLSAAGQ